MLLTDGVGTYTSLLTQRAAASGVTVYTVGLGSETDEALLGSIASGTGGQFYLVEDAAELGGAFDRIGDDGNHRAGLPRQRHVADGVLEQFAYLGG